MSETLLACLAQDKKALSDFPAIQARQDIKQVVGNSSFHTLSSLKKTDGGILDASMVFLVLDITNAFAGPHKSSNVHISSIIEAIKAKYYYLTLEELVYVFGQAKNGAYGSANFSGIDQPQIMRWLEMYDLGDRSQIVESKRSVVVKKELDELQTKELQSLISFEVVRGMYPECTEKDYLEASIADLQKLFLPTVIAEKAKESGVCYKEYLSVFPKAIPRTYLAKDSYELRLEFEKIRADFWEKAVADLNSFGFKPQKRNIMAYLANLIQKDYDKYKKELARLVEKLRQERTKKRKRYEQYQKTKHIRQKARSFRQRAYE